MSHGCDDICLGPAGPTSGTNGGRRARPTSAALMRTPGGRVAEMYARSTTIHGDPGSVDATTAYVRDEVMPAVRDMDGCVGLSMLTDSDTGRCIVTTSWRN